MAAKKAKIEWPEWCTSADFARLTSLSVRAVENLKARGVLVKDSKGIRTLESLNRYLDSLRKSAQGRQSSGGMDLVEERAKLASVQRQGEELKLLKLRGEVMDLNEVAQGWGSFAAAIRTSVLAIPGRVRQSIPHLTAFDGKTVDKICRDVLDMAVEELQGASIPGATAESIVPSAKKRVRKR